MAVIYTRAQINFIMNLKKKGLSGSEIALEFGKKFGLKKSSSAIRSVFTSNKHDYDLEGLKTSVEVKSEVTREQILKQIADQVDRLKHVPTLAIMKDVSSFTESEIRSQFGNYDKAVAESAKRYPEIFEQIVDDTTFTDQNFQELLAHCGEYRRFVVTTAVTGCEPHEGALDAIDTFCEANDACLLILPCSDPAKQREHKNKWSLSHKLRYRGKIVFRDLFLNRNLMLSTIKMSAKQLQPLTGLKRISQKNGSTIFASPKQSLEFATNSNNNSEIPRALMTTGSVTKSDYVTEMYMSERTGYLAEQDHVLGAVIVEIKDSKIFFFRQIRFDVKTGSFSDLNKKYHANGKIESIQADLVQLGDYHVMSTDAQTKLMAKEIVEMMKPDILTLEDFFDGFTINPHERHNLIALSKKANKGLLSIDHELRENQKEINELSTWPAKHLVFKYGNHEDFIQRWIADGAFMDEPENKLLGMKLNIAMEELGAMPFEHAMRVIYGLKQPNKVRFLGLNESFKVNGVENAAHGHLGKAGRRNPNLAEIEECFGAANVGHNHSAGIFRSVFRVGTSTKLQLSYNNGPSAWTQTHLIQHKDGSRQLITNINGAWRLK